MSETKGCDCVTRCSGGCDNPDPMSETAMTGETLTERVLAACDKLDAVFDPAFTLLWREAAEALSRLNHECAAERERREAVEARALWPKDARYQYGDLVQKTKGSKWRGRVNGFYVTAGTPIGYAVESAYEEGSTQAWPEAALAPWDGITAEARALTAEAALAKAVEDCAEAADILKRGAPGWGVAKDILHTILARARANGESP